MVFGTSSRPQADIVTAALRLGVLLEVNCETDFVARGAKFKELVQDMAMQAAASPSAIVVSAQEVPEDEMEKERQIEMGKEDIQNKPEAIRSVCLSLVLSASGLCMVGCFCMHSLLGFTCCSLVMLRAWLAQRVNFTCVPRCAWHGMFMNARGAQSSSPHPQPPLPQHLAGQAPPMCPGPPPHTPMCSMHPVKALVGRLYNTFYISIYNPCCF